MASLWMLVDFEPGYERFDVGDVVTPTLYWIDGDSIPGGVPDELVSHDVPATADVTDGSGRVWLTETCSVPVRGWSGPPGPTRLTGLLLYDRYQWINDEELPATMTVVDHATLIRARELQPTRHPNWYTPVYHGPTSLCRTSRAPDGFEHVWRCVRVELDA